MRFVKIGGGLVAVLVICVAVLVWREAVPEQTSYDIGLHRLRELARSIPGDLPVAIHSEIVASRDAPRAMIFAGLDFAPVTMVYGAYQIRFPDGRTIVVDSGLDEELANTMPGGGAADFRASSYEKVQQALRDAWQIVITHEHADHLGGIARFSPPEALLGSLRLTDEQLASEKWLDQVDFPPVLREQLEPLVYDEAVAIAPGVVLKSARGHTPGSQLVFVQLADGRELLLIGDVAWNRDALTQLHYRPRLVTWILGEDRAAVLSQFRALHELMNTSEVAVVVAHDARDLEANDIRPSF